MVVSNCNCGWLPLLLGVVTVLWREEMWLLLRWWLLEVLWRPQRLLLLREGEWLLVRLLLWWWLLVPPLWWWRCLSWGRRVVRVQFL